RGSTGSFSYRQMFRQDLPKENIDGEAIEWASRRLLSQNSGRKLLIILSDGAPVDDSTLMENGPHYLLDHHQSVVSRIVADGKISIGSLGIGYDMAGMYPYSACVEAPAE
ncbi:cobaltochelatase CobT-related protein, partial [Klebsiella pneumoniae]|uniref:cobaltochelatase CobT-related protein n=1 Tax=Klebsiella pneumoniae TaxID=573 RepID=UPI00210DD48E